MGATLPHDWIQAWNRRDLEGLLSHYSEDVEFRSPLVAKILGGASDTIRGKQHLRAFLEKVLAAFPGELDLQLLGVYQGVDSIVVHFESRGRRGAELMEFNADGLVSRALAHREIKPS